MRKYDAFVSHAWEDRQFANQLADVLTKAGLDIWFSGFELKIGDHLRRSIDKGIRESEYGIVILSPAYLNLAKFWTEYELDGLIRKEILPIWFNVDYEDIAAVHPSLTDLIAVKWNSNLDEIASEILRKIRPVPISQRRVALRRKVYEKLYHFEGAMSPALRLVGAGVEYFMPEEVVVLAKNVPYQIPLKYRKDRDKLISSLIEETKSQHKSIFDGPATRMLSYEILTPNPDTEKKSLRLVFGPLQYFDYAIVRRISDASIEDGGKDSIEEFVDIEKIAAGGDFSSNSLSNIVDSTTTVITRDGYIFFNERGSQVSDRGGWHTCSVAEGVHSVKDGINFFSDGVVPDAPFRTVVRGVSEELSPELSRRIENGEWKQHLRMLGISFDLEGFHPDLMFFLLLPLSHDEVRKLCREYPGVDSPIEGTLKSINISEGVDDIVNILRQKRWTPGGSASVIRTLEYLNSVVKEHRFDSIQKAIDWILANA